MILERGSAFGGQAIYTPYENPNLANQNRRKLMVFDRKLKGTHSLFYSYLAIISKGNDALKL